jgi:hypothetical protein
MLHLHRLQKLKQKALLFVDILLFVSESLLIIVVKAGVINCIPDSEEICRVVDHLYLAKRNGENRHLGFILQDCKVSKARRF